MKLWFLKWLIHWGNLLQGIIGIASFNLLSPSLGLKMAKIYSKAKQANQTLNQTGTRSSLKQSNGSAG